MGERTQSDVAAPADRLLRLPDVMSIVGWGKTMIYRKVRAGEFPQPYKPGGTSSRWSEQEVRAWLNRVKGVRDPKVS